MTNSLAKIGLRSVLGIFVLTTAAFGQTSYFGKSDSRNADSQTREKARTAAVETKRNERIAKQYFEQVWNKGNVGLLKHLVSEDYTVERLNDSLNLEAFDLTSKKVFINDFRRAFPDARFKITELRADAESVLVRVIVTGTHKGEFQGVKPTGKRIRVDQMQLKRFDKGKIVFHTQILDDQQLVAQLVE